jgi:Fe-S cluster assembly protein SufD
MTTSTTESTAAERLGIRAHSDGPIARASEPPVQTRSERPKSVNHADFPEVTGFEAEWKLTPVDRIRSLIDGELDGSPYAIMYPEVEGTTVEWIPRTDARVGGAGMPEERASANAWTNFENALLIDVTGDVETAITVTRASLGDTPPTRSSPPSRTAAVWSFSTTVARRHSPRMSRSSWATART